MVADPKVRTRPHWQSTLTRRIQDASEMLDGVCALRLEVAQVSEWSPRDTSGEEKRRQLGSLSVNGSTVELGFAADPAANPEGEPGIAMAFDPRVLVYDYPSKTEVENTGFLVHELGHLLGAWDSATATSLLHIPPGKTFDDTTRQVLTLTRDADLRGGTGGLSREVADQLAKLTADSGTNVTAGPLFTGYLYSGRELLNAGRAADAAEPLYRATVLAPRDSNAHYLLGQANLLTKRFNDAVTEFRKVVEIDPRHVPGWNGLGGALLQAQQPDEAYMAFQKASALEPGNPAIRINMGVALVRILGREGEGIAILREVQRDHPEAMNDGAQQILNEAIAAHSNSEAAEKSHRAKRAPR